METRNPLDLILRLLLLLSLAVVFATVCASCRSKQSAIENTIDTIRVTRAREVLRIDTIANTLHDSIFVHEVVNTAGEIQYRERIVYRDKNNVQYKDRVVHDTIYTEKKHNTERIGTTTPTRGNRWGFSTHQWGVSTILIGILILITIVYTKLKKKNMKETIKQLYDNVTQSILRHTQLNSESLLHSRKWSATTGRIILILTLLQLGISEPTIRSISGMSQQRVNYLKNLPYSRISHTEARILRSKVWSEVSQYKRNDEDGEMND